MSPEMFNPYDPKYKKVEDLPKEMQPKFQDYQDGFVTKAAQEEFESAEKIIRLAKELKAAGLEAKDILRYTRSGRIKEIGAAMQNDLTETDILQERAIKEDSEPTPMDVLHEEANEMHARKYPELFYIERLKSNPDILTGIPKRVWGNKKFALEAVKLNGKALNKICGDAWNKEVILEAVRHDGLALQYAPSFRGDKDVVLEAIKQNPDAIKYASKDIKKAVGKVMEA